MLDFLSKGFLGYRADFLSDLLIIALVLILPALCIGIQAARRGKGRLHRALMWTVLSVVIAYVVVYEASMLAQGGVGFLQAKIRMDPLPYFITVALHVLIAVFALLIGAVAVLSGRKSFRESEMTSAEKLRHRHCQVGYWCFASLVLSAITGFLVYYLTFVYVAAAFSG